MRRGPGYLSISRQTRGHHRRHHHRRGWWAVLLITLGIAAWLAVVIWGWSTVVQPRAPGDHGTDTSTGR